MKRSMVRSVLIWPSLVVLFTAAAVLASAPNFRDAYKGTPYQGSRYQNGAQQIPGRVDCAFYDRGDVYTADLLYSSNRGGTISVEVNGKPASGRLKSSPPSTLPIQSPGANGFIGISCRASCAFAFPREKAFSPTAFSLKAT